jgi:hybrid cluster-associated redox disulfide protein
MVAKKAKPAKAKITGKMTLGELAVKHPETVEVLFKYGMHCIGCHMSQFETIEQGALSHGMDKKAVAKMVREMNTAASR